MTGWRRYVAAGVVVLGVYVGLAFLNSPRGFLGTDTGGKVATLEVMTARGQFDPDLGYWAASSDPDGRLYPLAFTTHTASGKWVNVTTLPALWAGWQLYRVGGYRLALLVPMAGSLAAALAGLALFRRLGVRSDASAWAGFFILALASPLTIYALDFWEHSLGVALLAWAVVVLVDALGTFRWWRFAAAGALLGAAATMRTEALVYLGVAGIAAIVPLARFGDGAPRRRGLLAIGAGLVLLASAAAPVLANELVERRVVGDSVRSTRIAGTARGLGDVPTDRVGEAAITLVGLEGSDRGIALGVVFAALLVFAAIRRDRGLGIVAVAAAGVVAAVRVAAGGLGFVPGLAAAWVLPPSAFGRAHAGIPVSARPNERGFVVAVGLGAVPIVLATQLRGGAAPQWAGRYLLVSGFLLAVVGVAALESRPPTLRAAVVVLAAAVTAFGLLWTSVRTHDVARTVAALERRPEPVLVSGVYHLAREGGATYGRKRWLTLADHRAAPARAAAVLGDEGIDSFASVEQTPTPEPAYPGFHPTAHTTLRLFDGVDLRVTSWRSDAP
ncbi:MAG TPA: hypothetical protein VM143_08070 [Acidimicrobiales bacterium]|nr:hypothetical protein [Acidimicrobiales bacterium]